MSVEGQRFFITGAADGMGAATARLASRRGAPVFLTDINSAAGEATAQAIRAAGGRAWFEVCDVSDAEQVARVVARAAAAMGGIDVLHNNAGVIDSMFGDKAAVTVETFDPAIWDKVLRINLTGPMMTAKACTPHLKRSKNPSIINVASISSFVATPATLAYSVSKAAVAALTRGLAVELAPFGIRVNCYCPGVIETGMLRDFLEQAPNADQVVRDLIKTNLVPRLGAPEEVAELACFLAGDQARFINGVAWLVDGGSLAWRGTIDHLGM